MSDHDAVVVGYVEDFYELLRAIDEVMPNDAVLCIEGTSIVPEVATFLGPRQPVDRPAIEPNTLSPNPRFFHLPLAGTNLSELRALAERHAEPEVADHLVMYRDLNVLLGAHDAGDGYVALSRSLPDETIERFRDRSVVPSVAVREGTAKATSSGSPSRTDRPRRLFVCLQPTRG